MGQPNRPVIKYQSPADGKPLFVITETDGNRDYSDYQNDSGDELVTNDKKYRISCVRGYPYLTADVAEMAYLIIKNKSIPEARYKEYQKIMKRCQEALQTRRLF